MSNTVLEVQKLGQAIWYDFIRRSLITSGEFQQLIDKGVSGVTSNPSIFEKAIVGSTDYDADLLTLCSMDTEAEAAYETLALEDIRQAANLLRPVYDRTGGNDGYVSLEVNPALAYDTERTTSEARRLFSILDLPNIMIKVPATLEGLPAIRTLISEGININVTLIFSLEMYAQVRDAYITGIEDLALKGGDIARVASVASFFVSRIDTATDAQLTRMIDQGRANLKGLLGKAAIANAKLAYEAFQETFGSERFAALSGKGARAQRPLWASTSTKNPAYHDVIYVDGLIGADTVNTLPPDTLDAFLDHGKAQLTLAKGVGQARQTLTALEEAGINMDAITDQLLIDGVKAFADSFEKLLAGVKKKREMIAG